MPRILVAGYNAFPGPDRPGVQLRHVVRALLRDHEVDVLSVRRGDQAYVERWRGARLLRVPVVDGTTAERVEGFRRALRRQLEGADYHAVHVCDGIAGQVALALRQRLRFAVVYDVVRAPISERTGLGGDLIGNAASVESELRREADLVLVDHESTHDPLSSPADPADNRVWSVPPGVDIDAFDWDEPAPARRRILYAGSLAPGRGVRTLIRAMLDVVRRVDGELVLAGPTATEFGAALRIAIRDLGLDPHVTVVGEIAHERMATLITSAHVCVCTSANELHSSAAFPTQLLEYLACRRGVVAPRQPGVVDLLGNGARGLLYDPGNPADLAARLVDLLTNDELRSNLAQAGYEFVRRSYSASATRRQLGKAYRWLASSADFRDRFAETGEHEAGHGSSSGLLISDPSNSLGSSLASSAARLATAQAAGLDEEDGLVIDTGMLEGVGEITTVEGMQAIPDDRPACAVTGQRGGMDEWVVEDRLMSSPVHPLPEARFVAGEFDVPEIRAVGSPNGETFIALAPPLGFAVAASSEEGTSTSAAVKGAETSLSVAPRERRPKRV